MENIHILGIYALFVTVWIYRLTEENKRLTGKLKAAKESS